MKDLPTLGGKKKPMPVEEDSNGFGDFDFAEDHIGDSSNKLDDAEKRLQEFYKEESEGYRVQAPTSKPAGKPTNPTGKPTDKKQTAAQTQKAKAGFNVRIDGMNTKDDEDEIEEEIQTDRDDYNQIMKNVGAGLTESGGNYGTSGITVSQSLGVDPSVDSLALDEYDHIEYVMN